MNLPTMLEPVVFSVKAAWADAGAAFKRTISESSGQGPTLHMNTVEVSVKQAPVAKCRLAIITPEAQNAQDSSFTEALVHAAVW